MKSRITLSDVKALDVEKLQSLGVDYTQRRVNDRQRLSIDILNLTIPASSYLAKIMNAEKIFYTKGQNGYRLYITKKAYAVLVDELKKLSESN